MGRSVPVRDKLYAVNSTWLKVALVVGPLIFTAFSATVAALYSETVRDIHINQEAIKENQEAIQQNQINIATLIADVRNLSNRLQRGQVGSDYATEVPAEVPTEAPLQ